LEDLTVAGFAAAFAALFFSAAAFSAGALPPFADEAALATVFLSADFAFTAFVAAIVLLIVRLS
jgi:hypothetical protein